MGLKLREDSRKENFGEAVDPVAVSISRLCFRAITEAPGSSNADIHVHFLFIPRFVKLLLSYCFLKKNKQAALTAIG